MILAGMVRLIIDGGDGALDVCGKVAEILLMANILFTITLYSWMEQALLWGATRALSESMNNSNLLFKKSTAVGELAQVDELLISKDIIIHNKFAVMKYFVNGMV